MKKFIACLLLILLATPVSVRGLTALNASGRVYRSVASAPPNKVAIVFGAGVRNGQPTAILYDRVASAVALYKAGVVQKLLMSGDTLRGFEYYNEPGAMRRAALAMGVPDEDIVLDQAGRSTYDTCYRARDIFGVQSAILVTQDFHLDRAIFTCDVLGVKVVGYAADRRQYRRIWWNELREIPATLNAVIELFITRPEPVLGKKIVIE